MFDNLDSIAVMHTHGRCYSTNGADLNLSPPGQNGHHFADDTLKCIFIMKTFVFWLIKLSLKFVSKGAIDNNPTLVQIMAWRRIGDKLSFEPMN